MDLYVGLILLALNGLSQAAVDISKLCTSELIGDILPHPEDCTAYIVCDPLVHVQHCQEGRHFNAERKVCDWPQFAQCQLESNIQELAADHQMRMAFDVYSGELIDPLQDFDPQNIMCRHFGAYFLPHPQSCQSYYLCAYGHMHLLKCGLDTMWNFKKQQCEINYKAKCFAMTSEEGEDIVQLKYKCKHDVLPTGPGQTATADMSSTTDMFHPTGSGHTASNTATTADMSSTTDMFHPTGSGHTASNTATTADMSSTTDVFHPTGSGQTASNTATTADMGSTTDNFTPTGSVQTASNTATTADMGSTTDVFHPTGSGHTASNTATTAEMDFTYTPSAYSPSTSTLSHAALNTGTIESFTTATTISSTTSTSTRKMKKPSVAVTKPTPSKTPNSANNYLVKCSETNQGYLPHPKDCNKYFICIMGRPVMTSCPKGLHWDPKKISCDFPKNVQCFQ